MTRRERIKRLVALRRSRQRLSYRITFRSMEEPAGATPSGDQPVPMRAGTQAAEVSPQGHPGPLVSRWDKCSGCRGPLQLVLDQLTTCPSCGASTRG